MSSSSASAPSAPAPLAPAAASAAPLPPAPLAASAAGAGHVEAGQPRGSTILNIIRAKMLERGFTPASLATELNVSQAVIDAIPEGLAAPTTGLRMNIARVLGISDSVLKFAFGSSTGWNSERELQPADRAPAAEDGERRRQELRESVRRILEETATAVAREKEEAREVMRRNSLRFMFGRRPVVENAGQRVG